MSKENISIIIILLVLIAFIILFIINFAKEHKAMSSYKERVNFVLDLLIKTSYQILICLGIFLGSLCLTSLFL